MTRDPPADPSSNSLTPRRGPRPMTPALAALEAGRARRSPLHAAQHDLLDSNVSLRDVVPCLIPQPMERLNQEVAAAISAVRTLPRPHCPHPLDGQAWPRRTRNGPMSAAWIRNSSPRPFCPHSAFHWSSCRCVGNCAAARVIFIRDTGQLVNIRSPDVKDGSVRSRGRRDPQANQAHLRSGHACGVITPVPRGRFSCEP